ncbi:putative methyltransferase-domain-containing protein [Mucidula mucida]|nr:putative methyltransferase-domain-containing protein [Mucidula mucida]
MTFSTLSYPQPPTSYLPAIKKISSRSSDELLTFLRYLRDIYNPPVRGSKRRRASVHSQALNHANDWKKSPTQNRQNDRSRGRLTARNVLGHRRGRCHPPDLCIFLIRACQTDGCAPGNQDFHSVGAQTWGGACVLAEAIVESPETFGFRKDLAGLRILELGAGTGLVSLATAKMFQGWDTPVTIVSTDFYPTVLANLQANIDANFACASHLSARFLDWANFADDKAEEALLQEPFDVVLGADIVYEAQHAVWIKPVCEGCLSGARDIPSRYSPSCIFQL